MFGINFWEFLVIAVVGMAIFGPDKLPDMARQMGRFVRTARRMMDNARAELGQELGSQFTDLNLRDLDPRAAVKNYVLDTINDVNDDVNDELADDTKPGHRPLPAGERPPYDYDAT